MNWIEYTQILYKVCINRSIFFYELFKTHYTAISIHKIFNKIYIIVCPRFVKDYFVINTYISVIPNVNIFISFIFFGTCLEHRQFQESNTSFQKLLSHFFLSSRMYEWPFFIKFSNFVYIISNKFLYFDSFWGIRLISKT